MFRTCEIRWWTIGGEAFGTGPLDHVLLTVVGHQLQEIAGTTVFREDRSMSYPEWLHQFQRNLK